MFLEDPEGLLDTLKVFSVGFASNNEDVVEVEFTLSFFHFLEAGVHEPLEMGRGVLEAKEHDGGLVYTVGHLECHLPFMALLDA